MNAIVSFRNSPQLRLPRSGVKFSPKAFWNLCILNPDLNCERNADGSITVRPLSGCQTGRKRSELFGQLYIWSKSNKSGWPFNSKAGFTLPNSAVRAPNASWIRKSRWNALTEEQQESFAPLAPDFVAEVRSKSDKLLALRKKMREYIEQGVRLGWLIDPHTNTVEVYRPEQPPQRFENPKTLRAGPELPGFILDLKPIWARRSR